MITSDIVPIHITEIKPGLHERAEGITRRPIYRISWPKKAMRLFGRWSIPATKRGSAKYVRVPEQSIKIPPDAENQWDLAKKDNEVQEVAVFVNTHLADTRACLILAARIANDWYELYRGCSPWKKVGLYAGRLCDG